MERMAWDIRSCRSFRSRRMSVEGAGHTRWFGVDGVGGASRVGLPFEEE